MQMTGPGIHRDICAAEYHADPCESPSLSSSVAGLLVDQTPKHAWTAHPRLNPDFKRAASPAMNLGSVAHEMLLGKGAGFEISHYDDYRAKAAQIWRDDVVACGKIPIKAADFSAAFRMAEAARWAVSEIPGAEAAFERGIAEPVTIWRDPVENALCRCMDDWLDQEGGCVYDLKTTGTGLSDHALQARIDGNSGAGLDLRAAFHLRGLESTLIPPPDPYVVRKFFLGDFIAEGPPTRVYHPPQLTWRWVFMESEPPFECRVVEMDDMTRKIGMLKAARAIALWAQCLKDNKWPGYPRKIEQLEYRDWAADKWLEIEI